VKKDFLKYFSATSL